MTRATLGGLVLAFGLSAAGPALATVGGPTLCDVLGWDAKTKRVYVHEVPTHGGDAFGRILYFDFASKDPELLHEGRWTPGAAGEGTARDTMLQRRLTALRARLRPLASEAAPALPWQTEVLASDSLRLPDGTVPRAHVRARFSYGLAVEVATYAGVEVVHLGRWRIPGRSERLVVIGFRGDPFEGGYEVQVPLLVQKLESGVRKLNPGGRDE